MSHAVTFLLFSNRHLQAGASLQLLTVTRNPLRCQLHSISGKGFASGGGKVAHSRWRASSFRSASSSQLKVTTAIIACSPWVQALCLSQWDLFWHSHGPPFKLQSRTLRAIMSPAKVPLAGHKCHVPAHSDGPHAAVRRLRVKVECRCKPQLCGSSHVHLEASMGPCLTGHGPSMYHYSVTRLWKHCDRCSTTTWQPFALVQQVHHRQFKQVSVEPALQMQGLF